MQRSFKFRLVSTLSVALGAIVIIVIVVLYLGSDISRKADFISENQSKVLKASNDIGLLTKLKEQEKVADAAFFKLNNALPRRDALFSVSRDIGDMAKNRGLTFGSKFGEEVAPTKNKPGYIRVEMNTSGSYADIVSFIRDIESSSYFINLTSFDIVRQGSTFSALLNGQVSFSD